MSVLNDRVRSAGYEQGHILIVMNCGLEIRFPVADNPRLCHGTPDQLNHIQISPYGVHWPDLDEDLSFRGLLEGDYGQNLTEPAPLNPWGAPEQLLNSSIEPRRYL